MILLAKNRKLLFALTVFFTINLQAQISGADQTERYMPLLKGKKVALVANQTSVIGPDHKHLVDSLWALQVDLKVVFAPEHGFRGKEDAGAHIKDGVDQKTGLPIISLYGKNKKPQAAQLKDIDIIVFDIQDVGARFYTYISTLHYVMEAAAELDIPVVVLDRANPNRHYVDGPVLKEEFKSFVGMHPVPVVYGMTIGEYGHMIKGEAWINKAEDLDYQVIALKNYNHNTEVHVPIKPSPNLPNDQSIALYPSLCFFEGTPISAGRGTEMQFQIYGSPELPEQQYPFSFTPMPNQGAKYPKFKGELCYGEDLRQVKRPTELKLDWLIQAYKNSEQSSFFNSFFKKLAGTDQLEEQIKEGWTAQQIKKSWEQDLEAFKLIRTKYLLYP